MAFPLTEQQQRDGWIMLNGQPVRTAIDQHPDAVRDRHVVAYKRLFERHFGDVDWDAIFNGGANDELARRTTDR